MPKEFDRLLDAIKKTLSGKTNPRTKKKYTDSEIHAVAVDQWKRNHDGEAPSSESVDFNDVNEKLKTETKRDSKGRKIIAENVKLVIGAEIFKM